MPHGTSTSCPTETFTNRSAGSTGTGRAKHGAKSAKKTMQLDGSATLPSQKHQILNWFILVSNGFHLRERRDKVETMKCESNENHLRIILLHEPLQ
jgi:hypothetical protein